MSEIVDVQIGQSLPPERWHLAGERLAPLFKELPQMLQLDPVGQIAVQEDLQLALAAVGYVAMCGAQNVRFVNTDGLPHNRGDGK